MMGKLQTQNVKRKTDGKLLTIDEVKHVANLAKLSLTDEDLDKFQAQLSEILEYVNQLQQVDTTGVGETSQVTGLMNVLRTDESEKSLDVNEALSNAKNSHNSYVKVPGVLESN